MVSLNTGHTAPMQPAMRIETPPPTSVRLRPVSTTQAP